MKIFLLGAGASYGFDDKNQPPMTNDIFSRGTALEILTQDAFPNLTKKIHEYCEMKELVKSLSASIDVEAFFSWLGDEFESSHEQNIQTALGEAFYFIYELFRYYINLPFNENNNYVKLGQSLVKNESAIITLNYDVLLEQALEYLRLGYEYFDIVLDKIALFKLHGSINWINPMKGGISFGGNIPDAFNTITRIIYSNTVWQADPKVLTIKFLQKYPYKEFVRSGEDYDEPALIPPFSFHKDYQKVKVYPHVWDKSATLVKQAKELVIIGCSLRDHDQKINELLRNYLQENISITIVSPSNDEIKKKLIKIKTDAHFENPYSSFSQYVNSL